MKIEQTIDINPDRFLKLRLPFELPIGRARIAMTITHEIKAFPIERNSAFGCLHDFANPSKISEEKGAWERAVLEKYAKD